MSSGLYLPTNVMASDHGLTQSSVAGEAQLYDGMLAEESQHSGGGEPSNPQLKMEVQGETWMHGVDSSNSPYTGAKGSSLGSYTMSVPTDTWGGLCSPNSHDDSVALHSQLSPQPKQSSPTGQGNSQHNKPNASMAGHCQLGQEETQLSHGNTKMEVPCESSLQAEIGYLMPTSTEPGVGSLEEMQVATDSPSMTNDKCTTSCSKGSNGSLEPSYLEVISEMEQVGSQHSGLECPGSTGGLTSSQRHEISPVIPGSLGDETKQSEDQEEGCRKVKSLENNRNLAHCKEEPSEGGDSHLFTPATAGRWELTAENTDKPEPAVPFKSATPTEQQSTKAAAVTEQQQRINAAAPREQQSTNAAASTEQQSTNATVSSEQQCFSAAASTEQQSTNAVAVTEQQQSTNAAALTKQQICNPAAPVGICLPTDTVPVLSKNSNNAQSDQQREDNSISASQQVEALPGQANQEPVSVPNQEQGVGTAGQEKEGLSVTLTGEVKEKSSPEGEPERNVTQESGSVKREAQVKRGNHSSVRTDSDSPETITTSCFGEHGSAVKQNHPDSWIQTQSQVTMELDGNYPAYDNMSDSGVSDDFSPGSTLDGPLEPPRKETPIEREIRLAMEREEILRQSRGISKSKAHDEYVEIKVKPILWQSLPNSLPLPKDKDRLLAGFQMQKEIEVETKREEDLVQLGKVKGMYDKGSQQELQERKMIFEQVPEQQSTELIASNWATDMSRTEKEPTAKGSTPVTKAASPGNLEAKKGPSFVEIGDNNVIILEHGLLLHPVTTVSTPKASSSHSILKSPWPLEVEKMTVLESSHVFSTGPQGPPQSLDSTHSTLDSTQNTLDSIQDNPFFKLRSKDSQSILEQEIREAQEREQELRRQQYNLYGIKLSQKATNPKSAINGIQHAVHQEDRPLGKLEIAWPPHPTSVGLLNGDNTNEPLQDRSPRIPRRKSTLLQSWEAGMFANHQEDD